MQFIHRFVIFRIYSNLFIRLAVQNSERCPDFNLVLSSSSQERTNHSFLLICPSEVMVENGEKYNR